MVISSESDYINFLNENFEGNCIIYILTNNDTFHGVVSFPLAVLIKNLNLNKTYIINISHYDLDFCVSKEKLINDLNNLYCNKFVLDKKKFIHILPLVNLKDLQLIDFIKNGKIDEPLHLTKNYKFYYNKFKDFFEINNVIPLSIHSEVFENICKFYEDTIEYFDENSEYKNINENVIENLQKIESNGLFVNKEIFSKFFDAKLIDLKTNCVYTEYNIYTSTGRPSNRFGGINYSALYKDNGSRSSFVSRNGKDGMLLLMDYSAYHPHIVAKLINYNLPKDAYKHLGQFYFNKEDLTEEELKNSKTITFKYMYGNIPTEFLNIPFFNKMNDYINHRWKFFLENDYVETPLFKRKITSKHIDEPNPNKLFNYILQASETEFGMTVLSDLNIYLKNKLTKVVLYTYDSLLFDIHSNDGKDTLIEIKRIMEKSQFTVKCYIGHDYNNMISINI